MVSPEVLARLQSVREKQDAYIPNEKVGATLASKELVMIIGPAAVGKSFLIDELTKRHEDFSKVKSFATRPPRPDDTPETMMTIEPSDDSLTKILDRIDSGDVVNYSVHPTTNALYGTFTDSFPSTFNLLPTLASSTTALEAAPFREHHLIGLVASVGSWDTWFEKRMFTDNKDRHARLLEAASSLDWLLTQSDVTLVVNQKGQLDRTIADMEEVIFERGAISDKKEYWTSTVAEHLSEHIETLINCRCNRTRDAC